MTLSKMFAEASKFGQVELKSFTANDGFVWYIATITSPIGGWSFSSRDSMKTPELALEHVMNNLKTAFKINMFKTGE